MESSFIWPHVPARCHSSEIYAFNSNNMPRHYHKFDYLHWPQDEVLPPLNQPFPFCTHKQLAWHCTQAAHRSPSTSTHLHCRPPDQQRQAAVHGTEQPSSGRANAKARGKARIGAAAHAPSPHRHLTCDVPLLVCDRNVHIALASGVHPSTQTNRDQATPPGEILWGHVTPTQAGSRPSGDGQLGWTGCTGGQGDFHGGAGELEASRRWANSDFCDAGSGRGSWAAAEGAALREDATAEAEGGRNHCEAHCWCWCCKTSTTVHSVHPWETVRSSPSHAHLELG